MSFEADYPTYLRRQNIFAKVEAAQRSVLTVPGRFNAGGGGGDMSERDVTKLFGASYCSLVIVYLSCIRSIGYAAAQHTRMQPLVIQPRLSLVCTCDKAPSCSNGEAEVEYSTNIT